MAKKNKKYAIEKKKLPSPDEKKIWQRQYFFDAIIFLFCLLLFSNSIRNNYNLDDELVTINHRLTSKGISAIPEIFSSPYYQDESGYSYEYRPVVLSSFAIEHDIFGDNPHWSHFWNVILYAFSCVLLYRILLLLFHGYSFFFPLAITLLYAAHPAHTENVCSIKNRDEILGLFFSLSAFLVSILYTYQRKRSYLILIPVFFTLSLLSKLTFLSFLFIIPLGLYFYTEAGLYFISYVIIVLILPVLYLSHLGNTYTKLTILMSVCGIICIAFLIQNKKRVRDAFIRFKTRHFIKSHFQFWGSINEEPEVGRVIKLTKPDLDFFSRSLFFYSLSLLFVFAIATYYSLVPFILIPVFIFGIVLFRKDEKMIAMAFSSLCVIAVYTYIHFEFYTILAYTSSLCTILLYFCIYGNRNLFLPSTLSLLIILGIGEMHKTETLITFVPFFVMLFSFRLRWKWVMLFGLTALYLISIKDLSNVYDITIFLIPLVILYSLFLSFSLRNWRLPLAKILFPVCILFSLHNIHPGPKSFSLEGTVNNVSVGPAIKQESRPLDYVEQVAKPTDELSIRIGTSLEILLKYLTKTVIAYPLSFYYGYSYIVPMRATESIPLLSFSIYVLLFIVAIILWKKQKEISFALFIYLVSISTFANFFQPIAGMLADRFLLIPSIGWAILLPAAILWLGRFTLSPEIVKLNSIPRSIRYSFALVLIIYSLMTVVRNMEWENYLTLFRHDLKLVDNSSQAHNLLALRLMKTSYEIREPKEQIEMRKEALLNFKRAVEIYPPFFNATYDIGRVYSILGIPDSALVYFNRAADLNPNFLDAYMASGEILFSQNKLDAAINSFHKLIIAAPKLYTGYEKVSYLYFLKQNYTQALAVNKSAIANIPVNPQPYINLGRIFHTIHEDDSARYYLHTALEISPSNPDATAVLQSLSNNTPLPGK